jgi:hypothetical protein
MRSECILGRLAGGVDWIRLFQDRDRWRAVMNAVMNLRVLAPLSWLVSCFKWDPTMFSGEPNYLTH